MKNKGLIGIGAVLGVVMLLMFGYFALIVYINWPPSSIAENITVTREWTDIAVDPALKSTHRSQSLNLRIANFDPDSNSNVSEIKLQNGTVLRPEIELYDEEGRKETFHHSGFVSKYFDAAVFRPAGELSSDKRYSKVRIRSDVPFTCEGIYWIDYNPK